MSRRAVADTADAVKVKSEPGPPMTLGQRGGCFGARAPRSHGSMKDAGLSCIMSRYWQCNGGLIGKTKGPGTLATARRPVSRHPWRAGQSEIPDLGVTPKPRSSASV
jgi:hypothetical protein